MTAYDDAPRPPTATGMTLTVCLLATGWAVTAALALAAHATWTTARGPAPRTEDVIAALCTLAGAGVVGWLCLGATLSAGLMLQAGAGRAAPALARAVESIVPRALRRGVALAVGLSIAVSTLPARAESDPGPSTAPVAVDVAWGARTPAPGSGRPAAPGPAPRQAVLVQPGDTLWGLAAQRLSPGATPAEIAEAWPGWFTANRAVIGPDPHRILPGQRLVPPSGTTTQP